MKRFNLTIAGGAVFLPLAIQGAAPTPRNPAVSGGAECNVRDFGAKGDGTADDGPAIAAAVAAAGTGGRVYFPITANFYKTVKTLSPLAGQHWHGDGTEIRCLGDDANALSINGKSDVAIENLFIANTGKTSSGSFGSAISIGGDSTRCTIRGDRIEGTQGGIVITNASACLIANNHITSTSAKYQDSWDIAIRGRGSRNIIQNNFCLGGGGIGVLLQTATKGDTIDDNVIEGNQIGEHQQYGVCVYLTTGAAGLHRNKIVNNTVRDITGSFANAAGRSMGAGIYVQTAENTIVSGNHVYGCNTKTEKQLLTPAGIGCNSAIGTVISANVVDSCTWYGIMVTDNDLTTVASRDTIITGNMISKCGKDGILLSSTGAAKISGNSVDGVGSGYSGLRWTNQNVRTRGTIVDNTFISDVTDSFCGVDVAKLQDVIIAQNQISGFKFAANLTDCARVDFVGNHAVEFVLRGLYVTKGCTDCTISDNFLVSTSTKSTGILDYAQSHLGENHVVANRKFDVPPSVPGGPR